MSGWSFRKVLRDKELGYVITKATAQRKGDTYSAPTRVDGPLGLAYLSSGSLVGLDAEGTMVDTYTRGTLIEHVDPIGWTFQNTVLIAQEELEFWCITGIDESIYITGGTYDLAPDEVLSLSAIQGSKILVSDGSILVNGVEYSESKVLSVDSITDLDVTAGISGALLCVFEVS